MSHAPHLRWLGFLALGGAAAVASPVLAGTIVGSRHDIPYDLSRGSALMRMEVNDYDEICVYCHTPHQANTIGTVYSGTPLWNRTTDTSSFTMYASATIDTTIPGSPSAYSLICLSCHDGSLAVDSIINAPGSGLNTSGPWNGNTASPLHYTMAAGAGHCGECHVAGGAAHDQSNVYIGTNLSDDHPISMVYPTTTEDASFNAPTDLTTGWSTVKLYDGRVECPSCHNVHDPTTRPFLRQSNSESALCKVCHIK